MIWKNIKRGKLIWEPALLKESLENLTNPCRGWYSIYTFHVEDEIEKEELKWSLKKGESIALVLLDIGAFQSRALTREAMDHIRSILEFFQEYEKDVILRPVYDRVGQGEEKEPKDFMLVLEHLRQIGEILKEEPNTVFLFQGLLVGSWGEMHGSSYLNGEQIKEMWEVLHRTLGDDPFTAVRTPMQWRNILEEEAYEKEEYRQLGIFDDGIFGSTTHLGTFGTMTREAAGWKESWNRKEEMDFLDKIHRKNPFGGEVVAEESVGNPDGKLGREERSVLRELKKLHVTYLNCVHDKKLLDLWKEIPCSKDGVWEKSSLYDYIGAHLGYRLFLKEVRVESLPFGKTRVAITISNQGFAPFYQSANLCLVIRNESGQKEYPYSYEISQIQGGCERTISITERLVQGEVYLRLKRRKDGRAILFANENEKDTDDLFLGRLYRK